MDEGFLGRSVQRLLVRHAESAGNASGVVQGQRARIPLTPLGRLQATRLSAELGALTWVNAPLVISSDLRRAVETARPLAQRLGVRLRTERVLRERRYGVLEGRSWADVGDEAGLRDGIVLDPDRRPHRGESIRDVYERVAAFLDQLVEVHPRQPLILVTHGGPIRLARAHLDGQPLEGLPWVPVAHAEPEPLATSDEELTLHA